MKKIITLGEYYQKYIKIEDPVFDPTGLDQLRMKTYNWLKDKDYKDIVVAGVTHKMTLKKWLMRWEKQVKQTINQARKQTREKSKKELGYWYRAPTYATIPLWKDYKFLKGLYLHWKQKAEWQVNEEETVKTLVSRHPMYDEAKKLMNYAYLSTNKYSK